MRALALALLCLASVSFLAEAAPPDLASSFQRRWSKWEQEQQRKRSRRELPSRALPAPEDNLLPFFWASPKAFIRPLDAKDQPRSRGASAEARVPVVLVRRRRSSAPSSLAPSGPHALQHYSLRSGCRLGTCNTAHLAHRIFHLTDKDKDSTAPASKLSAHGYGRRRRRKRRRRR